MLKEFVLGQNRGSIALPGRQEGGNSSACSGQAQTNRLQTKVMKHRSMGRLGKMGVAKGASRVVEVVHGGQKVPEGSFSEQHVWEEAWPQLGECDAGECLSGAVIHTAQKEPLRAALGFPNLHCRLIPPAYLVLCFPPALGALSRRHPRLTLWGPEDSSLRILPSGLFLCLSNLCKHSWKPHPIFEKLSERSFNLNTSYFLS